MDTMKLAAAIAVGVFAGMTAWSYTQPAPQIMQTTGFQQAAFDDGCGSLRNPCYVMADFPIPVSGTVQVENTRGLASAIRVEIAR